jgi:hypothetical protein
LKYQTAVHAGLSIEMARKLVNFERSEPNNWPDTLGFSTILEPRTRSSILLPKWEQQVCALVDWFVQSNKPAPHWSQVVMSILKTRFNRFAQVIEARFSAGVGSV